MIRTISTKLLTVSRKEQSVLTIFEISAKQNLKINKRGVQIRKRGPTKNSKINKWGWGGDYYLELESIFLPHPNIEPELFRTRFSRWEMHFKPI